MKKFIYLFLLSIFIIIAFVPRTKEHAVIIKSNSQYSLVYLNNKQYKLKLNHKFEPGTVVNYKYNLFKILNVSTKSSIKDRIMCKNINYYDLEKLGNQKLSKKTQYYYLDDKHNLSISNSKSIIVGKKNVSIFKDKYGNLKTFIIKNPNYLYTRVGISNTNFNSIYHKKITLTCIMDSTIYNIREKFYTHLPKGTTISLIPNNDKILINYNNITKSLNHRTYLKGNLLKVTNINRGSPSFNPCYSGILEFTNINNNLLMINEVIIEDYLKKVVPSEMPSFGGIESLKCQAIAARTYAISDMLSNRFSNLGFYVDDSTQSQVYNNIIPTKLSNNAVSSTYGLIMMHDNKPIDAKYYSTSSGIGTRYEDIWFHSNGTSDIKPYFFTGSYITNIKSIPNCEYDWLKFYKNKKLKSIDYSSPYFRWHIIFSKELLEKCLGKSLPLILKNHKDFITILQNKKIINTFPKLDNLKNILITKRSPYGNVLEICFEFNNVSIIVKKDYNIRSAFRCNKDFSGQIIPIIRHKNNPILNANFIPSSFFSIEKTSNSFIVYGGGYGHGVGMSQYGALNLSKKGLSYEKILSRFYKNISISKIY